MSEGRELFEQAYREHLGGGEGDTVRRIAFVGGYRARSWQIDRIAEAAGIYDYPAADYSQLLDRVTHMRLALETLARSPVEYIGTMSSEDVQRIAEEGLTGHDTRGAAG